MLVPSLLLLLQAATTPQSNVDGHGAPTLHVPRVSGEIVIDGQLSEPAWESAARLTGFSQYQPVDGRSAEEPTEVRVFYTSEAIYFGIIATARDPGSIRATLSKRDAIDNDDRVTIYLDTFNDHRRAFFFGVNPLGVQLDGVRTEGAASAGNMFGGSVDRNPDYRFDTKGSIVATGYIVEMRIPFKSLRFPGNDPQHWGIQVVRDISSRGAEDTWTDAKKGASSFLAQSGMLEGIANVERGIVTDIQPFVTEAVNGERRADGSYARDRGQFDGGANVRVGFPALALDATVNPDFSQVESDAGLVTVNERFALFFPEKRPFFLEGIELFSTPNQLVYTRRVTNPIAGAKLTGKLGRFSVAYLSALDDTPRDHALFNVARLRTDYGGNSNAGLTVTDRRVGDSTNTVVAADTRVVFRKLYYFETQLGQSLSSDGHATRGAPIWKAELDRTGRIFGLNYAWTGLGDRFQSDAGFIPRVGIQSAHAFNRFAFYGSPTSVIQSFTTYFGPTRIWRYGKLSRDRELEGTESATAFVTSRTGWQSGLTLNRRFFVVEASGAPGVYTSGAGGAAVPYDPSARLQNLWTDSLGVGTPVYGRINASASVLWGTVPIFVEGAPGRELRSAASITLRPSPGTRVVGTIVHSRITRSRDGSEYANVTIPRLKAEYQPTRSLFFRVVSEYRSEQIGTLRHRLTGIPLLNASGATLDPTDTRELRTDWLASYEPTPGTVAYLGYGDGWLSPGAVGDTGMRRSSDGFFLKVAYLFRH